MDLRGFIAGRYLFARKSHNVINVISLISASGIAVGCAALIVILSIYNGFDSIVRSLYGSHTPDLLIAPKEGRTFTAEQERIAAIGAIDGIRAVCGTLEENVYVTYGDRQTVATAKGVDSIYQETTALRDYVTSGSFELSFGTLNEAVVGRTLAIELGLNTAFVTPLELWFPSRTNTFSLLDPQASIHKTRLFPSGIVSLEQGFDKKYIFVPLSCLQHITESEGRISSLEVYAADDILTRKGVIEPSVQKRVQAIMGEGFSVKNLFQQNDTVYKLLSYEKVAIYAILLFVMLIISSNIFGSLSMLYIEKKDDVKILKALGADDKLTGGIFVREGWLISLTGIAVGLLSGLAICLLQQKTGIVKMPGSFIIESYPVEVRLADIVITFCGVGLIGALVSLLVRSQVSDHQGVVGCNGPDSE